MRPLLILLAVLALAGCGEDDAADTASEFTTTSAEEATSTIAAEQVTSTTADARSDCAMVQDSQLLEAIKQTEAWAAKAPRTARLSGTNPAWYVASKGGALWVTNIQPDVNDDGGLTLPMNDEARAASDIGTAAKAGAPAYDGLELSDPGAKQALKCAQG